MAQIVQHKAIQDALAPVNKESNPISKSSFLQNIDYDPSSLQMTVTLKSGAQYVYFQVYPNTYQDFIKAPSKGKFYADVVKGLHKSTRTIDKTVGKQISKKP